MSNPTHDPNYDFNGDGRSDILWRSIQFGDVNTWITDPNGGFRDYAVYSYAEVPLNWHVAGIGDFNGDNTDDILWRQEDGLTYNWLAQTNGSFVNNSANSQVGVSTDWQVQGVGDFDGDGKDDVLWRDGGGLIATWLGQANGGLADNYVNSVVQVPTEWHIEGIGDFNGDGKDDILWRSDNGLITDWLGQANGGFSNNYFNSAADVPLEWHIDSIGDFNGDGTDDILWRHDTGVVCDWLGQSNGGFVNNYLNSFAGVSLEWQVAEIGDFNADGRDDILWTNDKSYLLNWAGQADGGFAYNQSYSMNGGQDSWWHVQGENFL